jgi:hypothetical protein
MIIGKEIRGRTAVLPKNFENEPKLTSIGAQNNYNTKQTAPNSCNKE